MAGNNSTTGGEKPRLSRKTWLIIVIFAFFGQVAWAIENNFFNLFVQDVFHGTLSDVAAMVSASAITATLTTLVAGAWSDRVGRRKPFVVIGSILWGVSVLAFAVLQRVAGLLATSEAAAATLGVTLTIVMDCVMTLFGSLANDAAFNAWLTDISDDSNRGRVEGVNSAMPLLAMLGVFGGALFLQVTLADGTPTYDYSRFFTIIGVLVICVGVLAHFIMDETHPEVRAGEGMVAEMTYGFRPSAMRENPRLYLVLLAYCVFAVAMQVFMPYYVLYLRLPYILGDAYVLVMAPCIVVAAVFTILYGRVMDKRGFSFAIVVPLVLFIAGCVLLGLFQQPPAVFVGSLLMLGGYLGSAGVFGAEIRNNTPADRVGLFQGLRIFMVVLVPMLVGPWIGSLISSSSGAVEGFGVVGDGFTPSSLIFIGGAVVALLTFVVLAAIKRQAANNMARRDVEEPR